MYASADSHIMFMKYQYFIIISTYKNKGVVNLALCITSARLFPQAKHDIFHPYDLPDRYKRFFRAAPDGRYS